MVVLSTLCRISTLFIQYDDVFVFEDGHSVNDWSGHSCIDLVEVTRLFMLKQFAVVWVVNAVGWLEPISRFLHDISLCINNKVVFVPELLVQTVPLDSPVPQVLVKPQIFGLFANLLLPIVLWHSTYKTPTEC